ncbi:hypothetical protein [Bradyrhizobium sp. CCBAU 11361]|uniref:hypothetical protein n=1 Tax=Bradyrhizobium sp. CCBAU 11361 TaxID=1630812 RepID=UPI0023043A69|nr:hypothetical protein [Bradyrhizobium sp. CCBAU 11361]MDA9489644.1 hypothetical protein [Bradyrhizobium sp. CCBAU 11361]
MDGAELLAVTMVSDDGLVHCRTKAEAGAIKAALQDRIEECELEMHPDKTKIIYCKDSNRMIGNQSLL